ncbi:membrane protein [Staphylococcus microti]|uniref:Membrane protein n=1 Tax=Staphylococcus microti TaxID=569857 RepID=A0A0D6XS04_9STAP|nr:MULTISPECIES: TcpD family membrane protein [Staphylococcus]KIX91235.1 membrane protein [Staphylococcus microti]PNZ75777.1 hypothetical protein CD132_12080 [Staphylococcus microti]SUM58289.1 transposon-related protein [Staphylococcus microti]
MNYLSSLLLGVPSISGLGDWIFDQAGTLVGIIVVIVGLTYWSQGKHGRMIGLFVIGGLFFLVSMGPETVLNGISSIWKMIFGG